MKSTLTFILITLRRIVGSNCTAFPDTSLIIYAQLRATTTQHTVEGGAANIKLVLRWVTAQIKREFNYSRARAPLSKKAHLEKSNTWCSFEFNWQSIMK